MKAEEYAAHAAAVKREREQPLQESLDAKAANRRLPTVLRCRQPPPAHGPPLPMRDDHALATVRASRVS